MEQEQQRLAQLPVDVSSTPKAVHGAPAGAENPAKVPKTVPKQ